MDSKKRFNSLTLFYFWSSKVGGVIRCIVWLKNIKNFRGLLWRRVRFSLEEMKYLIFPLPRFCNGSKCGVELHHSTSNPSRNWWKIGNPTSHKGNGVSLVAAHRLIVNAMVGFAIRISVRELIIIIFFLMLFLWWLSSVTQHVSKKCITECPNIRLRLPFSLLLYRGKKYT